MKAHQRLLLLGRPTLEAYIRNTIKPTWWDEYRETSGVIAKNSAYTGGVGAELLVNGDFSAWTADDPDGWSVTEVGDATSNVTENPAAHAQFISNGTLTRIFQNILTAGNTYRSVIDVTADAGGNLLTVDGDGVTIIQLLTSVGLDSADFISKTGVNYRVKISGATDMTIASDSVKKIGEQDAKNTAATVGQAGVGGRLNHAYDFDGTTSLLTVVDAPGTLKAMTTQKWAFLAKADGLGETNIGGFFIWGAAGVGDHYLSFNSTNRLIATVIQSGTNALAVTNTNQVSDLIGAWGWVFMDYSDSTKKIRLYKGIGGTVTALTLATDTAGTGTVTAATNNLIIGNRSDAAQSFDGLIDEALAVAGSLWTTAEMQMLTTLSGV